MSAAQKTNRETPAQPEINGTKELGDSVTALYFRGVERLAEMQKSSIDLAAVHNAEAINPWKKFVQKIPGAPGLFMFDLASSAAERFVETQKSAIDLVVEQSHAFAEIVSERTTAAAKATESAAGLVQQTVERTVASQKKALDQTAAHAKAAFESTRKQFGFTGNTADIATDSFQRSVDTMVEAQKELLDIAIH